MRDPHPENTDYVRGILVQRREAAWHETRDLIRQRDAIQDQASVLNAEVAALDSALDVLRADAAIGDTE